MCLDIKKSVAAQPFISPTALRHRVHCVSTCCCRRALVQDVSMDILLSAEITHRLHIQTLQQKLWLQSEPCC